MAGIKGQKWINIKTEKENNEMNERYERWRKHSRLVLKAEKNDLDVFEKELIYEDAKHIYSFSHQLLEEKRTYERSESVYMSSAVLRSIEGFGIYSASSIRRMYDMYETLLTREGA